MIDITHKIRTLRRARAGAIVRVGNQATIDAIIHKRVPKGDVLEMAKTAGLFAVKKTAEMIPDCHPLPIEQTMVNYEIKDLQIHIEMEVAAIYRTGVEVEAMHGVSVVALTMYDMLKPIDSSIEITNIRVLEKKGGKSDVKRMPKTLIASVIVCSDSISAGKKHDKAGKVICDKLSQHHVEVKEYQIIPDEVEGIQNKVLNAVKDQMNMVIITGGTGLSPRDVTPEAIKPLLDREIPGIMEAARSYGQERTPYAMLSRGVAGTIGKTLIISLPGSTNGAKESMDALFPHIIHIFPIMGGAQH